MKSEEQEVYVEVLKKIVEMMQKIVKFTWKKAFSAMYEPTPTKNSEHIWWILCLKIVYFRAEPHYLTDNFPF